MVIGRGLRGVRAGALVIANIMKIRSLVVVVVVGALSPYNSGTNIRNAP